MKPSSNSVRLPWKSGNNAGTKFAGPAWPVQNKEETCLVCKPSLPQSTRCCGNTSMNASSASLYQNSADAITSALCTPHRTLEYFYDRRLTINRYLSVTASQSMPSRNRSLSRGCSSRSVGRRKCSACQENQGNLAV